MSSGIPIPNILDRAKQFALIQFINNEDILGYRIRVANTLDNAYGAFNGVGGVGTTALFEVLRDRTFISKEIRQKGTAISGDITRGQTRATFDPNEFFGLSPEVPPDNNLWFVRTQVSTVASAAAAGSVPAGYPGGVFPGTASGTNQLYGTAPSLGTAVPGLPAPQGAMVFGVPAFADAIVITNHDAALPLYFAVAEDQPLIQIDPATSISHASGMKDDLVLCSTGGNPNFSLLISTVTGLR